MVTRPCLGDAGVARLLADLQQPARFGRDLADPERARAVGDQPVERDADVNGDEISLRDPVAARNRARNDKIWSKTGRNWRMC